MTGSLTLQQPWRRKSAFGPFPGLSYFPKMILLDFAVFYFLSVDFSSFSYSPLTFSAANDSAWTPFPLSFRARQKAMDFSTFLLWGGVLAQ